MEGQSGFQPHSFEGGEFAQGSSQTPREESTQKGFQSGEFSQGDCPTTNEKFNSSGFKSENEVFSSQGFGESNYSISQSGFQPNSEDQGNKGYQSLPTRQNALVDFADILALREAINRGKESLAAADELLKKIEFLPVKGVDSNDNNGF